MRWKCFKVHNDLPDAPGAEFFPKRGFIMVRPCRFYAFEKPAFRVGHSFLLHDFPASL
jgi:hypothetical protein